MNATEWKDWQSLPITKAFYEACISRIEDAKDILCNSAGLDPTQDNFFRGFIKAYQEMLDFRVEDLE